MEVYWEANRPRTGLKGVYFCGGLLGRGFVQRDGVACHENDKAIRKLQGIPVTFDNQVHSGPYTLTLPSIGLKYYHNIA